MEPETVPQQIPPSPLAEIDYSRKWLVMAAVAMSVFLATIDGSIVNVALPTLVRELGAPFPTVQWVVLSYLLTQVTLLLSVGRLGDMVGKKRIFNAGFVVFTFGSVLCGLAPGVYTLIGFRVLQAIGAAMALALGPALVTEAFPPRERGKALGIIGSLQILDVAILLYGRAGLSGAVEMPQDKYLYMVYNYIQVFQFQRYGYGVALSWIFFVIVLILTLLVIASSRYWVYYEVAQEGEGA